MIYGVIILRSPSDNLLHHCFLLQKFRRLSFDYHMKHFRCFFLTYIYIRIDDRFLYDQRDCICRLKSALAVQLTTFRLVEFIDWYALAAASR